MIVKSLMKYSVQDNILLEVFLNEIIDEFAKLIPRGPYLGNKYILVIPSTASPITYVHLLPNYYVIGLTPTALLYNQIAYQFAHELCHVYIDPRFTNWLIESFCECMSFIILERLFHKWQEKSSIDGLEWYAPNYMKYHNNAESKYFDALGLNPAEILAVDATQRLNELPNPYDRNWNFVNAYKILNIYKSQPNILDLISILHNSINFNAIAQNQFIEEVKPNITTIDNNLSVEFKENWNSLKTALFIS